MGHSILAAGAALALLASTSLVTAQEANAPWYFTGSIAPKGFVMVPDSVLPIIGNAMDGVPFDPNEIFNVVTFDDLPLGDGGTLSIEDLWNGNVTPAELAALTIPAEGITGTLDPMAAAVGVEISGAMCMDGLDGADWLDLCAGLNAFIGGASHSETIGAMTVTANSAVQSIGVFVKAKMQAGIFTFAPYAGGRQIFTQTSVSSPTIIDPASGLGPIPIAISYNGSDTAVFAGLETGFTVLDGAGEVGFNAEIGRGVGTSAGNEFSYGSVGLFARIPLVN